MKAVRFLVAVVLAVSGAAIPASPVAGEDAAPGPTREDIGEWSQPIDLRVVAIHAVLLHTGNVLLWSYRSDGVGSEARLFDPVTLTNLDVSVPGKREIFCSGHSVLPDGRVLVAGGTRYHSESGVDGTPNTTLFDPATGRWQIGAAMAKARWYPTTVPMPDGSAMVLTGWADETHVQRSMESYDPSSGLWTTLPRSASKGSDLYSKMVVLPDGRVFRAGADQDTWMYDPTTQSWSFVAFMNYGYRGEGGVVLLPGLHEVLTAGGSSSDTGTNTAELIDLSDPSPTWNTIAPMAKARFHVNLVLLADGTVLAVGGGNKGGYEQPVHEAELFDPQTRMWTTMAAQQGNRTYHSTALLLPDGRVISAGSDSGDALQTTAEIYSPPYLFRGPRPVITSAPETLGYGQEFTIETPDASDVTRVALVRAGSVTHTNNFDQRYVDLAFSTGGGVITATAPVSPNEAPPGWYMLFIVNSAGVPAVATFVQVG